MAGNDEPIGSDADAGLSARVRDGLVVLPLTIDEVATSRC